jgi:uncharacterized protein YkwD
VGLEILFKGRLFMKKLLIACTIALSFGTPVVANPEATQLINEVRKDKRRKAVRYSNRLEAVAAGHAQEMAANGYFSHTGANGSSVGDRTSAQGYKWCFVAENIARGQTSLQEVMVAWTNSKGHYKNMIHKQALEFGVARAAGDNWVMVLAKPC